MGTKTQNKRVEIEHEILEETKYERKTVIDPALAPGETREGNQSGHNGRKVRTYRLVYIDGVLDHRAYEATSTYTQLDVVTYVSAADAAAATATATTTTQPPATTRTQQPDQTTTTTPGTTTPPETTTTKDPFAPDQTTTAATAP